MIRLTGSQNPLIKEVRALKNKNGREERGRYFIEGTRFVAEALKESVELLYVMVSESFLSGKAPDGFMKMLEDRKFDCYEVPDSLFASISDTQNPQGILAVLGLSPKLLKDAKLTGESLVILDTIKDPGNMGTIIRTADAAGCGGVIVPDGCVDLYNPKVLRSTMGSVFHIPVYHCGRIAEAMEIVKRNGYRLCASHLEGAVSIYETDLSGRIALVIGSEADGICQETVENADLLIRIPMEGRAESLNASVAAGVLLFEAMRQRLFRKDPC